jgi:hypothetical protein
MDEFELSDEDEAMLDQLLAEVDEIAYSPLPDGWTRMWMAMPLSFKEIFEDTLAQYKRLTGSEKEFPAFEAMVMEARNSLTTLVDEQG